MATYKLKVWIDPNIVSSDIAAIYLENIQKHNEKIRLWKNNSTNNSLDAGFDIIVPADINVSSIHDNNYQSSKLNMGIITSMQFKEKDCSYYLYSRSSTPIKTPLRLANSVGIIDAGYRGYICALFDNISNDNFNVKKGQRLVQICSPNITYPIEIILINDFTNFSESSRSHNAFGSTG